MEPERGCGEKGPGKREREAGTMNIQTGAGGESGGQGPGWGFGLGPERQWVARVWES